MVYLLISTIQQTFAFLLKLFFDFFEKIYFFGCSGAAEKLQILWREKEELKHIISLLKGQICFSKQLNKKPTHELS